MGASEATVPPAGLKARVLAGAARQPQLPPKVGRTRPRRWTPRLLAAAAAVVLVVAAGVGIAVDRALQQPPPAMSASVARVFHAGDAHTAMMRTSNGGRIAVATSVSLDEMAVDGAQLPALGNGEVYQLWAIAHGKPHSAGLLVDPGKGAAMAMPKAGVRVAITIEPSGGSPQPTRRPITSVVPSDV
jgi:anti-sigma-K factor RskA